MPDYLTSTKNFGEEKIKSKIATIAFLIFLPFYVSYKIIKGQI